MGILLLIYPKTYSVYLRGTIAFFWHQTPWAQCGVGVRGNCEPHVSKKILVNPTPEIRFAGLGLQRPFTCMGVFPEFRTFCEYELYYGT